MNSKRNPKRGDQEETSIKIHMNFSRQQEVAWEPSCHLRKEEFGETISYRTNDGRTRLEAL